jgi:hypothetical protein
MASLLTKSAPPTEVTILARVLGSETGDLPAATARYYLSREFSDDDKARMHDLALRNQEGVLSEPERQELFAYAKAGSLLSILKSRARRALRIKPKKRTTSRSIS